MKGVSNKLRSMTRLRQLVADKTALKNRDEEEIMGYRDVLNTIHDSYEYIPIKPGYILQMHRDLFSYSEKGIGGQFKNTQNYISATDRNGNSFVLFTPLAPCIARWVNLRRVISWRCVQRWEKHLWRVLLRSWWITENW